MGDHQPVVVLADLPHGDQSLQVLVGLVGVDVVQGAAVPGVSVGGCEVDGNLVARRRKKEIGLFFNFARQQDGKYLK